MIYYIANSKPPIRNEEATKYLFTTKKLHDWFKENFIVELDTETEGFDPHTKNVLLIQFGNKENQFVLNTSDFDINEFKVYLEDSRYTYILQNAKFDLRFLLKKGIEVSNIRDTFINELVITQGIKDRRLALDGIVSKYCGYELDKSVRGEIHKDITERVIVYAAEDVTFLTEVYNKQWEIIKERNQEYLIEGIEIPFQKVLAEMEFYGLKVNVEKWKALEKENKRRQKELIEGLNQYIYGLLGIQDYVIERPAKKPIFAVYKYTTMGDEVKVISKVNWASDKHVKKIFKFIGIPLEYYDTKEKKVKESIEIKHIEKYEKEFEILKPYIEYSKISKLITTYGMEMLKYALNPVSNRIHTNYFPIINTGRTSSGDKEKKDYPNLQVMPKEGGFRECFEAEEGYTFLICDYPAQEPYNLCLN